MKNPVRITIALDSETYELLQKMKKEMRVSKSELMRNALRFYCENKDMIDAYMKSKVEFYIDMLCSGEHMILDVDHWLLFLNLLESPSEKNTFWDKHREIARAHADQLKGKVRSIEDLLERLEACNFFRKIKNSENEFTLVLGSETAKEFVKIFLEEFLASAGLNASIKENLAKLRVTFN
ncbi:CopG family transcriptional regulator [Candidatus Bathyarchaeota archaeon]|nr:CopG family transcriptional regulator [Candidatus Bathyarchaeota archaeon]